MSAPAATKGGFRAILERLDTWIEIALTDGGYSSYYVTDDYRSLPTNLSTMPFVTIKLEGGNVRDRTYGRRLPKSSSVQGKGSMATYWFTLHVFQNKNTASDEDDNRDAQICARIIMDYLKGRDQHATEKTTHNIDRVFEMGANESNPIGAARRDLRRMIVKGTIHVRRLDSP